MSDSKDDPYCRMAPSPRQSIACFYCGAGVPWFQCQCSRALEAREGKRRKPEVLWRDGRQIIVLDEETLANGWLNLPRFVTPVTPDVTPVTKIEPVTAADVTKSGDVTLDVTAPVTDVTDVTKAPLTAAERQRLKRARDRAASL